MLKSVFFHLDQKTFYFVWTSRWFMNGICTFKFCLVSRPTMKSLKKVRNKSCLEKLPGKTPNENIPDESNDFSIKTWKHKVQIFVEFKRCLVFQFFLRKKHSDCNGKINLMCLILGLLASLAVLVLRSIFYLWNTRLSSKLFMINIDYDNADTKYF